MAQVLLEHEDQSVEHGYWYCECGYEYGVFGGYLDAWADHLADELEKAGYAYVGKGQDVWN